MIAEALIRELRQFGAEIDVVNGELNVTEPSQGAPKALLRLAEVYRDELVEAVSTCQPRVSSSNENSSIPRISERGDLVIPMCAPARYRWWDGGQSIDETLRELGVSRAVWERYTDQPFEG